jgi:hypothetical protein
MRIALLATAVWLSQSWSRGAEVSTFRTYVDTDICARLMLGPITPSRTQCSQMIAKANAEPVLVRLSNNMVLAVNKRQLIEPLVGQLAEVSGRSR